MQNGTVCLSEKEIPPSRRVLCSVSRLLAGGGYLKKAFFLDASFWVFPSCMDWAALKVEEPVSGQLVSRSSARAAP